MVGNNVQTCGKPAEGKERVLFFVYGNLTDPQTVSSRLRGLAARFRYQDARILDFILLRHGARGRYDTLFPFKGGATWGKLLEIECSSKEEVLKRLDEYEGVPDLYEKFEFRTQDGRECYVYVSNPAKVKIEGFHSAVGKDLQEVIRRGGWRSYLAETGKSPLVEVAGGVGRWRKTGEPVAPPRWGDRQP
ncbi:MAG: gamma-glutamylcyclotransferase family protein [Candidatus Hadarchaeales archaeon]